MGLPEPPDRREGFEKLKEQEWVRLRMSDRNPNSYAKILHVGNSGLEVELCELNQEGYRLTTAFLDYRILTGYSHASEEEVKRFIETEPEYKRYFGNYVRLGTSLPIPILGKLTEVAHSGIILNPHVSNDIATQKISLDEEPLFIIHREITRITPATREKIEEYIMEYNRRMDEATGKEPKRDFGKTSSLGFSSKPNNL